jgi:hypothetical protein
VQPEDLPSWAEQQAAALLAGLGDRWTHVQENTLGRCADCGHQATRLLVGGAGQPDTSLCEAYEHRRYLAATGGRDLANQERARWASHPFHVLTRLVPALRPVTMVNSDR